MLSTNPAKRAAQLEDRDAYRRREWLGATREGWPSLTAQAEDSMPAAWLAKLLELWNKGRAVDAGAANAAHLARCKAITAAHRAGVPADANDARICEEARQLARDMGRRLDLFKRSAALELADRESDQRERLTLLGTFLEAMHWVELRGLELATRRVYIPGVLARLRCERWWRRMLRGLHARAVETTARAIGLVHKKAGCYVSDESLKRRQGQRMRNERALESVVAVNEHGQDYTLAELAARGPANRQIRRMELMTRIAGFELIAKECGHAAYFVTLTCPSRMHAYRTKPGVAWEVEPNPKHDGTTVEQAHAYMTTQWRRFNAAAQRAGLDLYGFRIAEPNHDGTPHWHCLLFFPAVAAAHAGRERPAYRVAVRLLRRYFLWAADPGERGARKHRVQVERIDWARGSAAGYVAKYVSKNIDGYRVEKDLYGNDTLTSSLRVDAWASTHRIRQFQQIGGAPVGVWRELRRLHPDQAEAGAVVAFALDACNITAQADQAADEAHDLEADRVTAAHGWAAYLHVQGGHRVPRRALRLGVLREQSGELGRYGELVPPKAVGVVGIEARQVRMQMVGHVARIPRRVRVEVESERATWLVVPKGNADQAAARLRASAVQPRAARPWSPVNNCTPAPLFGPAVERHKKRGRWHRWEKRGPGGSTEGKSPCPPSSSSPPTRRCASSPASMPASSAPSRR
ncbi:MAG TPA: replication endonuclease [Roseateles sp.]